MGSLVNKILVMNLFLKSSAASLLCLIAIAIGATGQSVSSHARVELLSHQNAARPGADLQLGIHFILEPGWHIYWINPGDSGQPPVLKWQLPPGFTAGEIEWPRPEKLQSTAQLADYGYHGEVLLPLTIHVPPSIAVGASVPINADAKWLVCREVCIPEHAQLHLELPVGQSAKDNPQSAALFAKTEKLLPRPIPRGWNASAKSEKDEFVLSVHAGKPVTKAEFFPLEPNQIDNPAPQKLRPLPGGVKIELKKSDLLIKTVPVLRGVLVLPGDRAYRIEAPVQ
jgi:thiol:disulfide interchange protein DsbD